MSSKHWLGDPMLDKIFKVVIQVAGELYVTKNRMRALEAYVLEKESITQEELEKMLAENCSRGDIERERDDFIASILSPIAED
jgi:Ca2+-binding EF-hand superfamily protein